MTWLGGRMRRRGLSVLPAPVLTAAQWAGNLTNTALAQGGESLLLPGSNFVPTAQAEVDGVLQAAFFNSASLLDITSAVHAKGLVNVRVRNPDGQYSNSVQLRYLKDPATISGLQLYVDQRGDAFDYHPTAGTSPGRWADRSGNGRDLYQATAGSRPNVTAGMVDGKYLVSKVLADGKIFPSLGLIGQFMTTTAAAGIIFCRAAGSAGNNPYVTSSGYPGPSPLYDVGGYQGWGLGATGVSTVQAGFGRYDTAWRVASVAGISANVLHAHTFRHASGVIQAGVDADPTGATAMGTESAGWNNNLSLLSDSTLTADYAAMLLANVLTSTDVQDFLDFQRYRNFPTAYP